MFTRLRLLVGAAVFAFVSYSDAASATTIWQIGVTNGANPQNSEFLPGDLFSSVFNYNVNSNPDDELNNPAFVGYLNYVPLSSIDPTRTQIQSAQTANIIFSLDSDYSDVVFTFNRFGSETNEIFFDFGPGPALTTVGPGEGLWQSFHLNIGNLAAGVHIISLHYAGGGADNGNYIDSLALAGTAAVPEPASSVLLLSGALAVIKSRRKAKVLG